MLNLAAGIGATKIATKAGAGAAFGPRTYEFFGSDFVTGSNGGTGGDLTPTGTIMGRKIDRDVRTSSCPHFEHL
jgi:hypothetical protein